MSNINKSKFCEPFGQKEDLISRLNGILKAYCSNTCVFKELIQNADDARATQVKFILDTRNLNFEDNSPLQGPALCVWNDSIFTEKDMESLIKLGQGSKKGDLIKIGKFGVGFNSVYNLTDTPQILSNSNDFIIFDPLCENFPDIDVNNPGVRIRNARQNLKNNDDTFFKKIYAGFEIPGIGMMENSTILRLPLRKIGSEISKNTCSSEEALELISHFIDSTRKNDVLLFLRNVKKISFFKLMDGENLELIDEQFITIEGDQHQISLFNEKLDLSLNNNTYDHLRDEFLFYKAKIVNQNQENNFLIFQQIGFEKDEFTRDLSLVKNENYFPFASIAFNIKSINDKSNIEYSIYNYLPMEEQSPISCHINGNWALREENRTNLYEYGLRKDCIDKQLAQAETDWNLSIINFIVNPLYIRLLHYLKSNSDEFLNEENIFADNFIKLFPQKSILKYFESMFSNFYKKIFNSQLIPIVEKSALNWFIPSELIFTANLDTFIYDKFETKQIQMMLKQAKIKICSYSDLVARFKNYSEITLNQISSDIITKHFRLYCDNLANKLISDTFLEDVYYLIKILAFCRHEKSLKQEFNLNNVNLENCPLLLTNSNKLTKFSQDNKIFFYENPEVFESNVIRDYFINVELTKRFVELETSIYVKKITINDLKFFLPAILDRNIYLINNQQIKKGLPVINSNNVLTHVWTIILDYFKSIKDESFTKNDYISKLKPIENWALIPVSLISSCHTHLAPFTNLDFILSDTYSTNTYFLYQTLVSAGVPKLQKNVFKNKADDLLEKLVVKLERNEDIVDFLSKHGSGELKYNLFGIKNSGHYLDFFNSCLYRNNNQIEFRLTNADSMTNNAIRNLINGFEIFKEIYNDRTTTALSNRVVHCVELRSDLRQHFISNQFLMQDFLDLSLSKPLVLMEYEQKYATLYSFLGISKKTIEDLYFEYFNWALQTKNKRLFLKENLEFIKIYNFIEENNQKLWDVMKKMKFIEINGRCYSANECYIESDELFTIVFPDKLIPLEYRTDNWKSFLLKLDLKTKCDQEDCIQIALDLRKKYLNKIFDINELDRLVRVLFREIKSVLDKNKIINLLQNLKKIEFIPNILNFKTEGLRAIISSSLDEKKELICLENSTIESNIDLCWIKISILPNYIETVLNTEQDYLNCAGILSEIDDEIVIENFLELTDILVRDNLVIKDKRRLNENLLNSLRNEELNDLQNIILPKYYSKFQAIFQSDDKDTNILDKLRNKRLILTRNGEDIEKRLVLKEANLFFKYLNDSNEIDDSIYRIPDNYLTYWSLFEYLGSKESIGFETCRDILEKYYNLEKNQKVDKLSPEQFDKIVKVIKALFIDNFQCSKNVSNSDKLYLPNALMEMKDSTMLYYVDQKNEQCENLFKNSVEIQQICLFDFKEIVNKSFKTTDFDKDQNLFKKILLENFDWKRIIEDYEFFKNKQNLSPKPLSKLIEETICLDEPCSLFDAKQLKLKSKEFQNKFIDSIRSSFAINQSFNLNDNFINNFFEKIRIFKSEKLKKVYLNSENKNRFKNMEEILNLYRTRSINLNIYVREGYEDEFEINLYLAKEILSFFRSCMDNHNAQLLETKNEKLLFDLINNIYS